MTCEQKYEYAYVQKLKRRTFAVPLERGTLLHDYLEHYYTALMNGEVDSRAAHELALFTMMERAQKALAGYKLVANIIDNESIMDDLMRLPDACERIATRYYFNHGQDDADEYDVLLVE